jgi:hypothetical protein
MQRIPKRNENVSPKKIVQEIAAMNHSIIMIANCVYFPFNRNFGTTQYMSG